MLDQWRIELRKREATVKSYQGVSLKGILTALSGDQLQVEAAQSALQEAREAYDKLDTAVSAQQRQIAFLQQQMAQIGAIEDRYRNLLDQTEQEVLRAGGPPAEQLRETGDWLANIREVGQQLADALSIGQEACLLLCSMLGSLGSAKNFGLVDMVGGGLIAGAMKYSRISDANNSATLAGQLVEQFADQLEQLRTVFVGQLEHVDIDGAQLDSPPTSTESLLCYFDIVNDCLIADLFTQKRLGESQVQAEEAHASIEQALESLETLLLETQTQACRLLDKRKRLILGEAMGGSELQPLQPADIEDAPTSEDQLPPIEDDPYGEAETADG